jgi:pantoate--beta-alanine ligase
MGALHEGHLSLIRRSRADNALTLASIFVNPTQFDDPADLAQYPRTMENDLATLEAAGTDYVLLPRAADLYADGYQYRVTESKLSTMLEGAHRPAHFDGVLTVVLKLLHIAAAERAYFGEKDWQQLTLIRGMAEAFFLQTCVVACPTLREADGLASPAGICAPAASSSTTSRIAMDAGLARSGLAPFASSTTCRSESAHDSRARRRQQPDLRRRL